MKLLGIPLLQSYTTEERRKLLIARSVGLFCSAETRQGKGGVGAGNPRKRLPGDEVLSECRKIGACFVKMLNQREVKMLNLDCSAPQGVL